MASQNWYIYMLIKDDDSPLNVGFSKDILKTIEFEKRIPSLTGKESRLIYLEIAPNIEIANLRFEEIYKFNREQKLKLIKNQNPDFVTIQPGVNIEI